MIAVESDLPPGAVCVITGELTRFAMFNQCLSMLRVPSGSQLTWTSGPLVSANMDTNFRKTLWQHDEQGRMRLDAAGRPLSTALQWAWIMGDDHTFDPDLVLRLLARRKDVILPLCFNREPPCPFTIIDQSNNRHRDFDKVPTAGVFALEDFEVCGDAGMLLTRQVLESVGPPWYEEVVSGAWVAEDRYFVSKLRKAGYTIHVDAESVLGHVTPCVITPVAGPNGWLVRFAVGHTPLVQFLPVPALQDEAVPA